MKMSTGEESRIAPKILTGKVDRKRTAHTKKENREEAKNAKLVPETSTALAQKRHFSPDFGDRRQRNLQRSPSALGVVPLTGNSVQNDTRVGTGRREDDCLVYGPACQALNGTFTRFAAPRVHLSPSGPYSPASKTPALLWIFPRSRLAFLPENP